jgi:[1-hydroxy-2-(trimethylamino)ethyl]phosphonate dioxygenase
MPIVDDIFRLFATKGSSEYGGERVSQLEHALQSAHLAQTESAPPNMIVAALLHDVGHLLADAPDASHEEIGKAYVAEHFSDSVSEPVKLHVAAKRYLCATDTQYLGQLSPASLQSLHYQGGPMSDTEQDAFEEETFFREAVTLRHWDDRAKTEGLAVPTLDSYRDMIESLVKT